MRREHSHDRGAYKDTANAHLKESPAERVRAAPAREATK
jgi:hypothetical protein